MKTIFKKRLICLPLVVAAMMISQSCKDDDAVAECGCNSPIIKTIVEETGTLMRTGSTYYIPFGEGQWASSHTVCNAFAIDFEVPEEGVQIVYDAQVMRGCGIYTDVAPTMVKITSLTMVK